MLCSIPSPYEPAFVNHWRRFLTRMGMQQACDFMYGGPHGYGIFTSTLLSHDISTNIPCIEIWNTYDILWLSPVWQWIYHDGICTGHIQALVSPWANNVVMVGFRSQSYVNLQISNYHTHIIPWPILDTLRNNQNIWNISSIYSNIYQGR